MDITPRKILQNHASQKKLMSEEVGDLESSSSSQQQEKEGMETFESPLLAMSSFFKAFQFLGVFNFAVCDNCTRFTFRPSRFTYSILLNILFLASPLVMNLFWLNGSNMSFAEVQANLSYSFSKTDFVAMAGLAVMLQLSSIGFHICNTNLGHHLTGLVSMVNHLGIINLINYDNDRREQQQNPSIKKMFCGFGMVLLCLLLSQFMIASSLPCMIGYSPCTLMKLVLGLTQALAVIYLHLPKIFNEHLFLRFVEVLEFHYKCLLEHCKDATAVEPAEYKVRTCIDHCTGLVKLFRAVEKTFCRQLFIQQGFMMCSLIFGIYLSISFIITVDAGQAVDARILFTMGFMLYSMVPAVRLLVTANYVDRVMVKMQEARLNLYEMEASTTDPECLRQIRCCMRQYEGIKGFSACNYFTVNPQLVTSIMGYLTTYIIVLLQFKMADINFK